MRDWQDIKTAPLMTRMPITIRTAGGHVFDAEWREDLAMDDDGNEVGCWCALNEDYPPCWSDGVCWASNEDHVASDPPVQWRPTATQADAGDGR